MGKILRDMLDVQLEDKALLSGKTIKNAKVDVGQYGDWTVSLEFNGEYREAKPAK